jgi:hypothetical protein
MQIGDLVKSVIDDPSVHTQRVFIVTEARINWIKILVHGESAGWLREDGWELVNESR